MTDSIYDPKASNPYGLRLDEPLPPDTPMRLKFKTLSGAYDIMLTVPFRLKDEVTAWAVQALAWAPEMRWRWHDATTNRVYRDALWLHANDKGPAPATSAPTGSMTDEIERLRAAAQQARAALTNPCEPMEIRIHESLRALDEALKETP